MPTTRDLRTLVINEVDSEATYAAMVAAEMVNPDELYMIPGSVVTSVNGQTGAVIIGSTDYVNITGSNNVYTADKTYAQLTAMLAEDAQVIATYNNIYYTLVSALPNAPIIFQETTIDNNGYVSTSQITIDSSNNITVRFTEKQIPSSISQITGTVPVDRGGTGKTSLTSGKILVGNDEDPILEKDLADHSFVPAGTVSAPSFSGTSDDISASGTGSTALTGLAVGDHVYKPTGTITAPTFTGTQATITSTGNVTDMSINTHSYTPAGSVTTPTFTGTEATISVEATVDDTHNTITIPAHTYTPAGGVSKPTFTGTEATITSTGNYNGLTIDSHTFTPTVSTSSLSFSGTATTIVPEEVEVTVAKPSNYTPAGIVSGSFSGAKSAVVTDTIATLTPATYTPSGDINTPNITVTPSTAAFLNSMSVTNGVLSFGSANAMTSATAELDDDIEFDGDAVRLVTTAAGSIDGLGFSGTATRLESTYTPAGTVTLSSLTMNPVNLSHTKSGSISVTATYTPEGDVSKPTFSGTAAQLSHGTATATITSTGIYTPEGTNSAITFSGTQANLSHTISNMGSVTSTATYTPAGSISAPTFNGTSVNLNHTVDASNVEINVTGEFTPSGIITAPQFTGTRTVLEHEFESV